MVRTRYAALVALGLVALLVAPSYAGKPAPRVLRGTTVVTADRTSALDLVLYDDALVRVHDDYSTPDISLTGKGRIVSATLQGPDSLSLLRYRRDGKAVVQTQANGSFYPAPQNCQYLVPPVGLYSCDDSPPGLQWAMLHQGHYRLRVLTDGSPVTVTLHLHGVRGSARYRTSTALAGGVVAVPVLSITAPQYQRYETTLKVPTSAETVLNVDAKWSHSPAAAGINWCDYVPTRPSLPTDYSYQCPGGQFVAGGSPFVNAMQIDYDPNAMFGLSEAWLDKGEHRIGFSVADSGGVTVTSALLAWIAS